MKTDIKTLPDSLKITVLAKYLKMQPDGERKDTFRPTIAFRLLLEHGERSMEVPYSGGILAFLTAEKRAWLAGSPDVKRVLNGQLFNTASVTGYWAEALEKVVKASAIDPVGVIHSLISDTRCGEDSFGDFCSNCGYDEDSRTAYATWEECRRQGEKFRRTVGPLFNELEKLTEDY